MTSGNEQEKIQELALEYVTFLYEQMGTPDYFATSQKMFDHLHNTYGYLKAETAISQMEKTYKLLTGGKIVRISSLSGTTIKGRSASFCIIDELGEIP